MNKYQEALNNLKEPTEEWLDKKLQLAENMDEPITFKHQSDINILQELVDKATLKKPNIWGDGYDDKGQLIYDMYDCPNCDKTYELDYEKYDYCPKCGQAIDWSDVNE